MKTVRIPLLPLDCLWMLIVLLLHLIFFWSIRMSRQLNIANGYVPSEPMSEGLGCGDKHSVVDSDKNSAKRSTVNKQLYDVTNIIVQLLLYSIRFARPSLTL